MCFGSIPVKCWSRTMPILALSSGESELSAVVKASGEALGFQASMSDFNLELAIEVHSDATAAIGMCRREGLGRVRHLSIADLWVQELVKHRRVQLLKCPTADNPADLCTKGLPRDKIQHHMHRLFYQLKGGRSEVAPVRDSTLPLTGPASFDEEDDGLEEMETQLHNKGC